MRDLSKEEAVYGYRRLQEIDVLRAVGEIKATMQNIEKLWDEEVSKYEETIMVQTDDRTTEQLRRNYRNPAGIIEDPSLFPYHSACYALLDCYDTHDDESDQDDALHSSEDDDRGFRSGGEDERVRVPNFLPNSINSIKDSLQNLTNFPERDEVLLRLLKHSMADFQPDHRLTVEILLYCRDFKCFRDVQFYRRVIACVLLDRIICNGRCNVRRPFEPYDHLCDDWQQIELVLGDAFCTGVDEFTYEHALLVCAFFKMTLDMANPSAGEKDDEIVTNVGQSALKSRKAKLKQAIYLWKMTDYDDDDSDDESDDNNVKEVIPYRVLCEFVDALRRDAGKNRHRRWESEQAMNSFCNAIGTFVFMGETSVRRLPAKHDSIEFCSMIVSSFVGAYVYDWEHGNHEGPYILSPHLPSVINPDRYANAVNQATERFLKAKEWETAVMGRGPEFEVAKKAPPRAPRDALDVIRSCFARDLAEVGKAGCGYGDCLVWMDGEITAHDAFLFFSDSHNYPVGDEENEEPLIWVFDEDGAPVSPMHLSARYDLTLLKLVQAWNSSWSPARHHSYQAQYRSAVRSLILCSNRLGLPQDIAFHIAQFLPRSFWPDERARCWCDDCSVDNAVSLMTWKLGGKMDDQTPKLQVSRLCECKVAMYKNNEHRKKDAGQHRKWCNTLPLRIPGPEEALFCQLIEAKMNGEEIDEISVANQEIESHGQGEDDDDEGSWESIDTDEEEMDGPRSITAMIYDFFRSKSYKYHETEESAFEAMYN